MIAMLTSEVIKAATAAMVELRASCGANLALQMGMTKLQLRRKSFALVELLFNRWKKNGRAVKQLARDGAKGTGSNSRGRQIHVQDDVDGHHRDCSKQLESDDARLCKQQDISHLRFDQA